MVNLVEQRSIHTYLLTVITYSQKYDLIWYSGMKKTKHYPYLY